MNSYIPNGMTRSELRSLLGNLRYKLYRLYKTCHNYDCISKETGCEVGDIDTIYKVCLRIIDAKINHFKNLSPKLTRILTGEYICTKEEVLHAYNRGKFVPNVTPKGYGKKHHNELCKYLGITTVNYSKKFCPHCNNPI